MKMNSGLGKRVEKEEESERNIRKKTETEIEINAIPIENIILEDSITSSNTVKTIILLSLSFFVFD